jgi:putative transposase
MPDYRRAYVPGATVFLTIVTYRRRPSFAVPENVSRLRRAIRAVQEKQPFDFPAAVILPDHMHVLWSLSREDTAYPKRVGLMKVAFTQELRGRGALPIEVSASRRKHRESDVWQRRYWEHTIEDEEDFERHLSYIHYNPVKHGLTTCPHLWPNSSFPRWVRDGLYDESGGCSCDGRIPVLPEMANLDDVTGE